MRILKAALLVGMVLPGLHAQAPTASLESNYENYAQMRQVIDKVISGTANTVMMDMDSVLLAAAGKSALADGDLTAGRVIRGLNTIQLRIFDVDGDATGRTQPVRELLKPPRWIRYAASSSKDGDVEIWSGRDGNVQTGVLLLSVKGKRVFILNIAGDIRPDELVYLSGRFGLPSLHVKAAPQQDSPSVPSPSSQRRGRQ